MKNDEEGKIIEAPMPCDLCRNCVALEACGGHTREEAAIENFKCEEYQPESKEG